MPTILAYFGIEIPYDIDGNVINDIFIEPPSFKRLNHSLENDTLIKKTDKITAEERKMIEAELKKIRVSIRTSTIMTKAKKCSHAE